MNIQKRQYQEVRSALNWPLLTYGMIIPVAAEILLLVLVISVSPGAFSAIAGAMLVPIMIYISLLYRNWPTGIRIDETGISIGAIRSARATSRKPTVNHQAWGVFTCPWSSVVSARVVTNPAELRELKTSPRYYTLTNRWGSKLDMTHCNIGVLTSPFIRAALVVEVFPSGVAATTIRPARFFNNFKNGYFSRRVPPQMSATWVAPTRNPEDLSQALANLAGARGWEPSLEQ